MSVSTRITQRLAIAAIAITSITAPAAFAQQPTGQQPEPRLLTIESDPPACALAVRAAAERLLAHHRPAGAGDRSPHTSTGPLLTWLWLSRDDLARDLLTADLNVSTATGDDSTATGDDSGDTDDDAADDVAWCLLHHYWYLRASGDRAMVARQLPSLLGLGERLVRDATPAQTFAKGVLRLHAVACCGGLLDSLEEDEGPADHRRPEPSSPGVVWARRAATLRADLERRYWSPSLAQFTAAAGDAPITATDTLLPCWIGMLATTGDKTRQNALAALRHLGRGDASISHTLAPPPTTTSVPQTLMLPALATIAITQFEGDLESELATLLRLMTAAAVADNDDATASPFDPLGLGAAVDALLFALTGVRMATGPGIDEDWLRLRPHLPPGGRWLRLRGLRHDGWCGELTVARQIGAPGPAEQQLLQRCGEAAAADVAEASAAAPNARITGDLVLRSPDPDLGYYRVVLHCQGRQLIAPVHSGERFEFAVHERPAPALLGDDAISDRSNAATPPRDR